jgi:hypothetical protein
MSPLERYRIFGLPRIKGWLDPFSAEFIATLAGIQTNASYNGAVGEIGVHHGKLFLLLLLAATPTERVFAVDVFEQQHLNVDQSGHGDREIFLANIRQWRGQCDDISIIARSSLEVTPDDIVSQCGKARLVSIDGGHTEECTLNDLMLTQQILTDHGVAVIDDYFNPDWPDVSTGAAKYLANPATVLRPFAITPNKVFLTAPGNARFYRAALEKKFERERESVMFGSPVDIYGVRQPALSVRALTVRQFFRARLMRSRIGPYILAAKASLLSR